MLTERGSGLLTEYDWNTEEMTEYINYLLDRLDTPMPESDEIFDNHTELQ